MINRYGRLQKIGTAGLTALLLCCTFLVGCGSQEKTGNLPENAMVLDESEKTGETVPRDAFHFDPAPDVVNDLTESGAEESQAEEEGRCVLTLLVREGDQGLIDAAAGFNRQSDCYSIRVEKCDWRKDLETCRARTQVELIAGRGPDIFIGDVLPSITNDGILEKGLLMDLAPLLDAAGITDESYFPAVRALTKGEHVYGICTAVYPHGCWVLESVLGGRERPDLETLVDKLYSYPDQKAVWRQYIPYYLLLEYFLGGSEDLWGMIDWENGQCDFSGDLFKKILQITKRYADPDGTGQTAVAGSYEPGWDIREDVESKGVIMDYPFDDGWYPYCSESYVMMINANTKYPEGACEFIKYLLGEGGQNYVAKYRSITSLPINRSMADSCMEQERKMYAEGRLGIQVMRGDTLVEYNPTEELVEELTDYANRARYQPLKTKEILLIIYDEAELFFYGDKPLEAVCDLIQNRVQLYLDENR